MAPATPVGDRVKAVASLALLLLSALPACAGTYFVTVAGLGGEPDYEQRFTAAATDLDRILKSSGSEAHSYTLTGVNSTRQHIEDTLNRIAREAKPEDDFVLILIGHGRLRRIGDYLCNHLSEGRDRPDASALQRVSRRA